MSQALRPNSPALRWPARPRIVESDLARRRFWDSRCGRFRVEHAQSHYGLPDVWRVYKRHGEHRDWWVLSSRHRSKKAAFRAAKTQAAVLALMEIRYALAPRRRKEVAK